MLQLKINNNLNIGEFNLSINCSLDFSNGIIGVCGPSGSGKTLFLRVIAGLEKESEGIVCFNKIIFQDDSKKIFMNTSQRNAVMVFQENRLFSNLKVKDNILFGYRRRKRESKNCLAYKIPIPMKYHYHYVGQIYSLGHWCYRRYLYSTQAQT